MNVSGHYVSFIIDWLIAISHVVVMHTFHNVQSCVCHRMKNFTCVSTLTDKVKQSFSIMKEVLRLETLMQR